MTNPWLDPSIAQQQRTLVDAQLQATPWPRHFTALADAVRATQCPGTVLEVGCGVGHGREILDRAGIEYAGYTGVDISPAALALARERYPESKWDGRPASGQFDVVIDGACVMHVEDWKAHLAKLCAASRRWAILHRLPAGPETTRSETHGYGRTFPAWEFKVAEVCTEMERHGFRVVTSRGADGDSMTVTFAKPRHWATYLDRGYLGRAKALHASMLEHCGPFVLHVLAWDADVLAWADNAESVKVSSAWPSWLGEHPDLAIEALPGPRRTKVELYWTCGPQWVADVMQATGEPVTYVDADIMFHSSPEPVFAEIGGAAAGVVPHNFAPQAAGLPGPTRETHEVFGKYNVGIVHFGDIAVAKDWAEECRSWCYDRVEAMEAEGGGVPLSDRRLRYGDQKFLDEWPTRFGAHVVQHPGAELGPWAIHARALDVRDGVIHFGNRPLVAYHYSSFKQDGDRWVASRPEYGITERQRAIVYTPYIQALEATKGTP